MDQLFAMEELAPSLQAEVVASPAKMTSRLVEIQSHADPVLLQDSRVLPNLIERQKTEDFEDYFKTVQTEVKPHMRKIVSDWMLQVTEEQQCQPEVFHLAMNYLDRYMSRRHVKKSQFQLVASVCMFLASKFKETCALPAEHLVIYTDYSVSVQEIMNYELNVLDALNWDLSAVTPYSILDHLLMSLAFDPLFDKDMVRKHAETFVALAATEYTFCHKSPAVVAVACLGAALRGLSPQRLDSIMSSIHLSCGVQTDAIRECMDQIEVSITLSMSGMSFQPNVINNNNNNNTQSVPKMIKPQQQKQDFECYPSASTTPKDMTEVAEIFA